MTLRRLSASIAFFYLLFLGTASAQTDSLSYVLDTSVVRFSRNTSRIGGNALTGYVVDSRMLSIMPHILGNSDPVRFIKFFPGIQTNAEGDNGVRINGCDNSHNVISLEGVPVYGSSHLMGFFSVFNTAHHSEMELEYNAKQSARLGGRLDLHSDFSGIDRFCADVELGLISARATFIVSVKKKLLFAVSGRGSFLNLLYKPFLKVDGNPMAYDFFDTDASLVYRPDADDELRLDFYCGGDFARFSHTDFQVNMKSDWGNLLAALNWKHKDLNNKLYVTAYKNQAFASQAAQSVYLPSSILTLGYRFDWKLPAVYLNAEVQGHFLRPQVPQSSRHGVETGKEERDMAGELTISAGHVFHIGDALTIDPFLKGHLFVCNNTKPAYALSPAIDLGLNMYSAGKLKLLCDVQHQFLSNAGISHTGLPFESWFVTGKYTGPQASYGANLSHYVEFSGGMYTLTSSLYYKHLRNQLEYFGSLFDMFEKKYDISDKLYHCNGNNFGLNIMAQKRSGAFTGLLSANVGRSLRNFNDNRIKGSRPSNHERLFEINAVASYTFKDWVFSATGIVASGTPFTAPRSYYMIAGYVSGNYGDVNSSRLPPYIRLDISISYKGINLSIYNVTGNRNPIFYSLKKTGDNKDSFAFSPLSMGMRFLPSISYSRKF